MRHVFNPPFGTRTPLHLLIRNSACLLVFGLPFYSCTQDTLQPESTEKTQIARVNATSLEEIITVGQVEDVAVTVRSHGSGYHANARCRGFIPAGQYAGHHFIVTIEGEYSGLGPETLVAGSAEVKIRSELFESVTSIELNSFCCGEGYINDFGTHFEFTVFGQVEHTTEPIPHNHLFAGFGSTLGTMNFNVADQSGTVTESSPGGPPPHDPGIGLIENVPARPVNVVEIP